MTECMKVALALFFPRHDPCCHPCRKQRFLWRR